MNEGGRLNIIEVQPSPSEIVRAMALQQGFSAVGFAPAQLPEVARQRLRDFLEAGFHGDMGWLAAHEERRGDPQVLWPEARSIIVLGFSYAPREDALANLGRAEIGNISVYARGLDYHEVIKKKLRVLATHLVQRFGADVKFFVDTAPVMEKPLAQQAGLGWQGKHTNLVSRQEGSWLFLAEIFTSLDLAPAVAEVDHCGSCQQCLDICPTRAFVAPYQLDARRCISYLTIEHKGPIERSLRPLMGNRIYGCDDCLAVCPWNKFATRPAAADLAPRPELTKPRLLDLLALDEPRFRAFFSRSPIKRTGRARFLRNVLIALGNAGDASLVPLVQQRLLDESALIRGAAVWCLSRLMTKGAFQELAALEMAHEADAEVREEWQEALREMALREMA